MTVSPRTSEPIAHWRLIGAFALSLGSALFTFLWLTIVGFFLLQVFGGVSEGGELIFIGMLLTAPPVCILTIGALLLAGPKHSKLAWISAIAYTTPFMMSGLVVLFSR